MIDHTKNEPEKMEKAKTEQLKKTFGMILLVYAAVNFLNLKDLGESKHLFGAMYEGPFLSGTHAVNAKFNFERTDSIVRNFIALKAITPDSHPTEKEIREQIALTRADLKEAAERTHSQEGKKLAAKIDSEFTGLERFLSEFLVTVKRSKNGLLSRTVRDTWMNRPERLTIQQELSELSDIALDYKSWSIQKEDLSITMSVVLTMLGFLISCGLALPSVVHKRKERQGNGQSRQNFARNGNQAHMRNRNHLAPRGTSYPPLQGPSYTPYTPAPQSHVEPEASHTHEVQAPQNHGYPAQENKAHPAQQSHWRPVQQGRGYPAQQGRGYPNQAGGRGFRR
jgi:hypothetical protein